jgi:hypothetical protein
MCLNEDFDFERDAAVAVKPAFSGEVRRLLLQPGTRLWKWTDHLDPPAGRVSPWWVPLQPSGMEGLNEMIDLREVERQVAARGGGARSALRHAPAILPEWNSMGQMLVVALQSAAYAFAGRAAMQQMTDLKLQPMSVFLAGGHGQLFIPNLNGTNLEKCDAREELQRIGIEDVEFYLKQFTTETPAFASLQPKTRRLLKLLDLLTSEEKKTI